jgi:hypothetical protein
MNIFTCKSDIHKCHVMHSVTPELGCMARGVGSFRGIVASCFIRDFVVFPTGCNTPQIFPEHIGLEAVHDRIDAGVECDEYDR